MILVLLIVLAIPFVAAVGSQTYADRLAQVKSDAQTKHAATAQLLADAPGTMGAEIDVPRVPARWVLPDGTARTGNVPAHAGQTKGTNVQIWLDRSGNLTDSPASPVSAAVDGVTVSLCAWLAVVTVCGLMFGGVRAVLMRRRMRWWAQEWARVERDWTRH